MFHEERAWLVVSSKAVDLRDSSFWAPLACRPRSVLRDRDAIDLDVEGPGPLRHAEEDAGWGVFREVALVDFVEGLEPLRRDAQHIALEHMVEVRPGGLQKRSSATRRIRPTRSGRGLSRSCLARPRAGGRPGRIRASA